MTEQEKLLHCVGCHDDFYNHREGQGRCWSLSSMKLVLKKKVHVSQTPPWTQKPIKVPDCKHVSGYVFVGPKQIN